MSAQTTTPAPDRAAEKRVLRDDPAWASLTGHDARRRQAMKLMAVRWAVRNGKVSDG